MTTAPNTNDIRPVAIEEEMKRSYLDYAMSVIVSRALPDVRDGLKPVHRRILHAMKEAGNEYNKPYRKSARVVGDVMGKYHPHGNAPIYEAMVRLTQDFSLRLPLIDGQGNFGSMDGDSPAAERYTEARLSKAAHELLVDIDQETVDYQPNYDDTLEEPKVLPARFPNLLVNGTNGIAVGMATYIPTHNLGEVIDACSALIENPDLDVSDLLKYIPGPDFPTGGIIQGRAGIIEAFKTGRGGVVVRGRTHVESIGNNREAIIITEIPFQVNKARLVERIADLVRDKTIEGISDLRDESDRDGVRVVIELKRDTLSDVVLNQLYKHSALQTSINYNMLALSKGRPQQLSLKEILQAFIEFREEVIVRRTRYDLKKARERAHVLAGFAVAVANIDEVISLIRSSKDRAEAREKLLGRSWNASSIEPILKIVSPSVESFSTYNLSEDQANAILDLRLHRLTGLERDKIQNELGEVAANIQEYLSILASRVRIYQIMNDELQKVKQEFSTPRKTDIDDSGSVFDMEDLIQPEDMVITISVGGYIKRVPLSSYRAQRRGGKGRTGMNTHDEDTVSQVIVANTHDQVLFFSSFGRVYAMKTYRLPIATPQSKGRSLVNLLPFSEGEKISTILVIKKDQILAKGAVLPEGQAESYLMFATSRGNVRRNRLSDFASIASNGKKAIVLDEGETLVGVKLCTETQDILLSTNNGITNRFSVTDVRVFVGRDSNGVRGIRLKDSDYVVSIASVEGVRTEDTLERDAYLSEAYKRRRSADPTQVDDSDAPELESEGTLSISEERYQELASVEQFILTVTEKGFGKITSIYEYRTTNRGSQGYVGIQVGNRNGKVVKSFPVEKTDEIFMISSDGQVLRCSVDEIRTTGRRSQGVIVFRLPEGEKISSVYGIAQDEMDDEETEIGQELETENTTE